MIDNIAPVYKPWSIASSQSSVILIDIHSVKWWGRNPDFLETMTLNEQRYCIKWVLNMCLSSSLEMTGRTEIGRKLFGSEAGPDLWPGVTRASLRAEGQVPDWMLQLRTLVRLSKVAGEMSFSKGAIIPWRPVAVIWLNYPENWHWEVGFQSLQLMFSYRLQSSQCVIGQE